MAAEAVADRSGSGLTNATILQAVVLDTELHVWLDGGQWKRIMIEGKWLWLRGGYERDERKETMGRKGVGGEGRKGGGGG
jgi:hypothetical protein